MQWTTIQYDEEGNVPLGVGETNLDVIVLKEGIERGVDKQNALLGVRSGSGRFGREFENGSMRLARK